MSGAATRGKVLIVDDDPALAGVLRRELARTGLDVRVARSHKTAVEAVREDEPQVVLLDLRLGTESGLDVLSAIRAEHRAVEVILLTGHGTIESAVKAMRLGAREYLTKPCDLNELEIHVEKALEASLLLAENRGLREYIAGVSSLPPLLTRNADLKLILDSLERVAQADVSVLIQGESGTGKELVARRIHSLSRQAERPFVAVNCAVLNKELLASDLFGHERGSFTGATHRKLGLFEIAAGGTVFLDEIGEMDPEIQAKLLRVLQSGEIRRVGSTESTKVKVRVLAATNQDLERAVEERRFRDDLLFRLNVVTLRLPPLRDRLDDIEPLFDMFARAHGGGRPRELSPEALALLRRYSWPGNVRELENFARRILVFHDAPVLGAEEVHAALPRLEERENEVLLTLEEVERRHILRVLCAHGGDKRKAAEVLGVSLKTIYNKLHSYAEWEERGPDPSAPRKGV